MELGACLGSCCGSSGCCGSCLESTSIDFSYNRRRVCNNVMPLLLKKKNNKQVPLHVLRVHISDELLQAAGTSTFQGVPLRSR